MEPSNNRVNKRECSEFSSEENSPASSPKREKQNKKVKVVANNNFPTQFDPSHTFGELERLFNRHQSLTPEEELNTDEKNVIALFSNLSLDENMENSPIKSVLEKMKEFYEENEKTHSQWRASFKSRFSDWLDNEIKQGRTTVGEVREILRNETFKKFKEFLCTTMMVVSMDITAFFGPRSNFESILYDNERN